MLGLTEGSPQARQPASALQRKTWEWSAIAQALSERDMLRSGRSGIGFAVGREPLPALFAAQGVRVLATDQPTELVTSTWSETGQHAASREALFHPHVCSREVFDAQVGFEPVDMTHLDALPRAAFDFAWSSCSFEHLGSLQAGLDFVLQSTELLRPGGIAVHTTEFNLSSNARTMESGDDVIYRRQDLERLDRQLRGRCAGLARLDLFPGDHPFDLTWDHPPYFQNGRPHLKLLLHGYVVTSVLLIIHKGDPPETPQIVVSDLERNETVERHDTDTDLSELAMHVPSREMDAESLETETTRARNQSEISTKQSQIESEQAHRMLDAMKQSRSWRMTAPLRKVARIIKRKH